MGIPDFIRIEELRNLLSRIEHTQRRHPCDIKHNVSDNGWRRAEIESAYPSMSMILVNWLYSLVPGNKGKPRNSSTAIHPSDHMSIAEVYDIPNNTSGER
jgi:hypothetical protein